MNWYKLSQSAISIDMSAYEQSLWSWLLESLQRSQLKDEKVKTLAIDPQQIISILQKYNYPNIAEVQYAINTLARTKDYHSIYSAYVNLFRWYIDQTKVGKYDYYAELRRACQMLSDLSDQLQQQMPDYQPYGEEQVKEYYTDCVNKSKSNMQLILQNVQQAIERIPTWHNLPVIIECSQFDKDNYENPVEDGAQVLLGNGDNAPSFTYWNIDGKVEIEDVLEAGDDEFFRSSEVQSDYFTLIREIKNPGSSSQSGKILTLFTARPQKDRHVYENATSIPSNIFLTNRVDSANGIAYDLGSTEPREVWKVRIDSRYLITTLDSPVEKQYQVVGDGQVPVKSISLY